MEEGVADCLKFEVIKKRVIRHLHVVPDGQGRWMMKMAGKGKWVTEKEAYEKGASNGIDLAIWFARKNAEEEVIEEDDVKSIITLCVTTANNARSRDREELHAIRQTLHQLHERLEELVAEGVRVEFSGSTKSLEEDGELTKKLKEVIKRTSSGTNTRLILLVDFDHEQYELESSAVTLIKSITGKTRGAIQRTIRETNFFSQEEPNSELEAYCPELIASIRERASKASLKTISMATVIKPDALIKTGAKKRARVSGMPGAESYKAIAFVENTWPEENVTSLANRIEAIEEETEVNEGGRSRSGEIAKKMMIIEEIIVQNLRRYGISVVPEAMEDEYETEKGVKYKNDKESIFVENGEIFMSSIRKYIIMILFTLAKNSEMTHTMTVIDYTIAILLVDFILDCSEITTQAKREITDYFRGKKDEIEIEGSVQQRVEDVKKYLDDMVEKIERYRVNDDKLVDAIREFIFGEEGILEHMYREISEKYTSEEELFNRSGNSIASAPIISLSIAGLKKDEISEELEILGDGSIEEGRRRLLKISIGINKPVRMANDVNTGEAENGRTNLLSIIKDKNLLKENSLSAARVFLEGLPKKGKTREAATRGIYLSLGAYLFGKGFNPDTNKGKYIKELIDQYEGEH